jgi:hypothetical protein
MPRYYFNTADGHVEVDEEGQELPNAVAARTEGVRFLGEILRDNPPELWEGGEFRVDVTNADGLLLYSIAVMGVIAPAGT